MARFRTVTVGTVPFAADCVVPRDGIGFFEFVSLTLRGRIDARRTREVADVEHTHSLHRLHHAHRRHELEAVRRIDAAASEVDRAISRLRPLVEALPTPPAAIPDTGMLSGLSAAERAAWAREVRAARSSAVRAAESESRRDAATIELEELRSIRESIGVEGDDVCRQWREAYAIRAAVYTRARSGRRGAAVAASPRIAPYLPAEAARVVRGPEAR